MKKKILITGVAGFIGFNLAKKLLEENKYYIVGIDNIDNYYSTRLKVDRLKILKKMKNFFFYKIDICKINDLQKVFKKSKFDYIYHLAAQAGVRYSIDNPKSYLDNNICAYFNLLECLKKNRPKVFFYASSSSVYGNMKKFPLVENSIGSQKNMYSLSKKFNEELAKIYANLYNIKTVGLRFFTVYGEWGRPDMFYLKYLEAIRKKRTIQINNFGNHSRDFTYISDVVEILIKLLGAKIKNNNEVYNICSSKPIPLMKMVNTLNILTNKKAKIKKVKLQMADVIKTHGNNSKILKIIKKDKFLDLYTGLKNTVNWYKNYKL